MSRIFERLIATKCTLVTPHDTNFLPHHGFIMVLGDAGNVKVQTAAGDTVIINLEPKEIIPLIVSKVFDTGTQATNIYLLS
jgi:hypothetical protein